MTSFADLKRVCDSVNGKFESGGPDGRSGNIIFVWAELQPNFQGQPYCAGGVSWTWKHAGHPFPAIDHPWGYSYCPDGVNWFKKQGLWATSGYEPGDTIFFDWPGKGVADHTGIVMADGGQAGISTFEYNTSPTNAGSQQNGGGCYYRTRSHGATVLGVGKSSKWLVPAGATKPVKPAPKPSNAPLRANPFPVPTRLPLHQGAGGNDAKFTQWAVGVPVDGSWGPQTTQGVMVFQKQHGLVADGVVGPQTMGVLRQVTRQ